MLIATDLAELQRGTPTILTMGAFDGVHRGHQWLIRQVVDRARRLGFQSLVLTFAPRPEVVLRPGALQLTDAAEKERLLAALGPDRAIILPFTPETAALPAGSFLERILEHVNLAEIWIGADFAFGHQRQGTPEFLIACGAREHFAVHVVPRQALDGVPISSTLIRKLVSTGQVHEAARFLGHWYSVRGPVVTGYGRGKQLGFPTANVQPPPHQQLPATGIYAGFARLSTEGQPAAISVGYNPVFGNQQLSVEAYLLDWEGDLRQRIVALDLVQRIREERNFAGIEALVQQMNLDVAEVGGILAGAQQPGELLLPQ